MFLAVPVCSTCNYPLVRVGNGGFCQNCYNRPVIIAPVVRPIIVVPPVIPVIIPQRLRNDQPVRPNTYRKCFCCNSGASEIFTDRRGNNHFVCDKSYCNYELRRRYS